MLQRSVFQERPQRPIHQEVRQLTDDELSKMCHSRRLFPGAITPRTRRQAERQLHIALIEERARFRARQQFAEECRLQQDIQDLNFRPKHPPPQEHYAVRTPLPQRAVLPPDFWPRHRTVSYRSSPPPISNISIREDPVLEPRGYVPWQRQNRIFKRAGQKSFHKPAEPEDTGSNFLGFNLPFSLETAREISTKIGETLKRFQGVGEAHAETRFEGGSIEQGNYDERRKSEVVDGHQEHQTSYHNTKEARGNDASAAEYQADESEGEDLQISDEECDRDTLFNQCQNERQQQAYVLRELNPLADVRDQTEVVEHSSGASSATTYHDFLTQEPQNRVSGHSWWWWWPQRVTAGDERIPEAEQTQEREHKHEHEVKSINYLVDPTQLADDGVMELMHRVDLRDDSEEEDLVVLPDGSLSTQPSARTCAGFCRSIFRLLLCDRDSRLDPQKLRFAFIGCCMAFGIFMGCRLMR